MKVLSTKRLLTIGLMPILYCSGLSSVFGTESGGEKPNNPILLLDIPDLNGSVNTEEHKKEGFKNKEENNINNIDFGNGFNAENLESQENIKPIHGLGTNGFGENTNAEETETVILHETSHGNSVDEQNSDENKEDLNNSNNSGEYADGDKKNEGQEEIEIKEKKIVGEEEKEYNINNGNSGQKETVKLKFHDGLNSEISNKKRELPSLWDSQGLSENLADSLYSRDANLSYSVEKQILDGVSNPNDMENDALFKEIMYRIENARAQHAKTAYEKGRWAAIGARPSYYKRDNEDKLYREYEALAEKGNKDELDFSDEFRAIGGCLREATEYFVTLYFVYGDRLFEKKDKITNLIKKGIYRYIKPLGEDILTNESRLNGAIVFNQMMKKFLGLGEEDIVLSDEDQEMMADKENKGFKIEEFKNEERIADLNKFFIAGGINNLIDEIRSKIEKTTIEGGEIFSGYSSANLTQALNSMNVMCFNRLKKIYNENHKSISDETESFKGILLQTVGDKIEEMNNKSKLKPFDYDSTLFGDFAFNSNSAYEPLSELELIKNLEKSGIDVTNKLYRKALMSIPNNSVGTLISSGNDLQNDGETYFALVKREQNNKEYFVNWSNFGFPKEGEFTKGEVVAWLTCLDNDRFQNLSLQCTKDGVTFEIPVESFAGKLSMEDLFVALAHGKTVSVFKHGKIKDLGFNYTRETMQLQNKISNLNNRIKDYRSPSGKKWFDEKLSDEARYDFLKRITLGDEEENSDDKQFESTTQSMNRNIGSTYGRRLGTISQTSMKKGLARGNLGRGKNKDKNLEIINEEEIAANNIKNVPDFNEAVYGIYDQHYKKEFEKVTKEYEESKDKLSQYEKNKAKYDEMLKKEAEKDERLRKYQKESEEKEIKLKEYEKELQAKKESEQILKKEIEKQKKNLEKEKEEGAKNQAENANRLKQLESKLNTFLAEQKTDKNLERLPFFKYLENQPGLNPVYVSVEEPASVFGKKKLVEKGIKMYMFETIGDDIVNDHVWDNGEGNLFLIQNKAVSVGDLFDQFFHQTNPTIGSLFGSGIRLFYDEKEFDTKQNKWICKKCGPIKEVPTDVGILSMSIKSFLEKKIDDKKMINHLYFANLNGLNKKKIADKTFSYFFSNRID